MTVEPMPIVNVARASADADPDSKRPHRLRRCVSMWTNAHDASTTAMRVASVETTWADTPVIVHPAIGGIRMVFVRVSERRARMYKITVLTKKST